MIALLDTCVFFWLFIEPEKISSKARAICESPDSDLYVSIASLWEIQIKLMLGKMKLDVNLSLVVDVLKKQNGLKILSIEEEHVHRLKDLPSIHGDPFDRMLIAQAKVLNAVFVTPDEKIAQYPVNVIW